MYNVRSLVFFNLISICCLAQEEYDPFVHAFPMLIRSSQRKIVYLEQKQRVWQSRLTGDLPLGRYDLKDVRAKIGMYKKEIGRTHYKLAYYALQQAKNKEFSVGYRAKLYFDVAQALCSAHQYGRYISTEVQENIYSFFRKAALFYEYKKWYRHALDCCEKMQYCLDKKFVIDDKCKTKEKSILKYAQSVSIDALEYALTQEDEILFSGYLEYAVGRRYLDEHGLHAEFISAARAYLAGQERSGFMQDVGGLEDIESVGCVSDLYETESDSSQRVALSNAMRAGTKRMRDEIGDVVEPISRRRHDQSDSDLE